MLLMSLAMFGSSCKRLYDIQPFHKISAGHVPQRPSGKGNLPIFRCMINRNSLDGLSCFWGITHRELMNQISQRNPGILWAFKNSPLKATWGKTKKNMNTKKNIMMITEIRQMARSSPTAIRCQIREFHRVNHNKNPWYYINSHQIYGNGG